MSEMKAIHLPEEKLNELAQRVSQELMARHHFSEGVIRGGELASFTEHEQINKFLLFQVFQVWNMQLSKLKHPFFDFDQEDIQQALQQLRNLLSQHIRIEKEDFQPMVQRAVYNNLKLLLDPKGAFSSFFFISSNQTALDLYQKYVPFFSDLDFVVNSILKYCQKNQIEAVEKELFFSKMDRVFTLYSQKSGQHIDAYRSGIIEKLTGKSLQDLEGIAMEEKAKAEQAAREAEAAVRREAEAKRKAEEAAKQQAEEAKRLEEEARAKEAEAKRLAEEEAKRKAEEEAQRKASLFDNLVAVPTDVFDIDMDEDEADLVEETVEETPVVEAPVVETPETATTFELDDEATEAAATEVVAEVSAEVEVEAPVIEEDPALDEVKEITSFNEIETLAEPEIDLEEPPVIETEAVEEVAKTLETAAETVEEVVDSAPQAPENEEAAFLEMAASMEPNVSPEEETPKTILDSLVGNTTVNGSADSPKTILDKVTGTPPTEDEGENATVSFLDRFLNDQPETPESPLSIVDRFIQNNDPKEEAPVETPLPEPTPEPAVEAVVEEPAVEEVPEPPVVEAPTPEPIVEPEPIPTPEPEIEPVAEAPVVDESASSWEITEEERPASILEKLQERSETIADKFATPAAPAIVGVNGNRKIQLDEIPIHKQYQFVQKVFDGNNVRFRVIVEKVNNAANKQEVEELLSKYILGNSDLNQEDAVVNEFITLLRNRF